MNTKIITKTEGLPERLQTVKEINSRIHLGAFGHNKCESAYIFVSGAGCLRVTRVRIRKGQAEALLLGGGRWMVIPKFTHISFH